ncbi:MAG: protein-(glutamine-N5) methyltransferase, release factor-specific [Betaproteobacteria bacterium TMED82]|nr:MAG: protein-(glutamine-N5) methyltransferase, release factor-specific [Betaproteobacteria bacterium TMED82]|tara:strand:- start:3844 stop:4659 length:816 start_codon:yes stop_codon:yes gene_type:complete
MSKKKILARIISFILKKPSHWLFVNENREFTKSQYEKISGCLKLFQYGLPQAYIFGKTEFYSREFIVSEDVLIPRCDSELIVKETLHEVQKRKNKKQIKILELGTGSGALIITVAKECKNLGISCVFTATDISKDALAIAKKNVILHDVSVDLHIGDWWDALDVTRYPFDIVFSNPPYVGAAERRFLSKNTRFEPKLALYGQYQSKSGLASINEILSKIDGKICASSGLILIEHGFNQQREIKSLIKEKHLNFLEQYYDLSGIPRVVKIGV